MLIELAVRVLAACLVQSAGPGHHHYEIQLELSPARRYLEAEVVFDFRAAPAGDSLVFYLHRQLALDSVWADGLRGFVVRRAQRVPPYMPYAQLLMLRFDEPPSDAETTRIAFRYSGRLTRHGNPANALSEDWVELNLYSPFFPYNIDYGPFTYTLNVSLDEPYSVVGMGRTTGNGTSWTIEQDAPAIDIILTASKDYSLLQRSHDGLSVTIGFTSPARRVAEEIVEDGLWLLATYAEWLGDVGQQHASVVVSPRDVGGGYARKGFIVLAAVDEQVYSQNQERYFKHMAHEFAHIWWSRAPVDSWEDWLNESFAEYSALMAVREVYGPAAFDGILEEKWAVAFDMPPLVEVERNSEGAYAVLYNKGPILLNELEMRLGGDRFRTLLREAVARDVSSTDRFLELLGLLEGEAIRSEFAALLAR
ncbi:MAG: hypothetical protein JSV86_14430 [Gemmatimonadota bacterium]|nr:MAG: hypothetical protein JSV86_14430 [Gemmatimonadota bacterium]